MLSVSPALLEGYVAAARRISRLAVGDPTINPVTDEFKIPACRRPGRADRATTCRSDRRAARSVRYQFPLDGEYQIKVRLKRQLYLYIIGMGEPHQLDIRLDRALVKRFTIGGEAKGMTMPESFAGNTQGDPEFEEYMHTADAGLEVELPVKAGTHEVGVSFVGGSGSRKGCCSRRSAGSRGRRTSSITAIRRSRSVAIGGPYQRARVRAATHRAAEEALRLPAEGRARRKSRARRQDSLDAGQDAHTGGRSTEAETSRRCWRSTGKAGPTGSFDAGIRRGVERILAAPSFLFRIEHEPAARRRACRSTALNDLDLASRLSFFLWSSIPDDELLNAAIAGKLKQPAALEQQVRRMLADPRVAALVDNFVESVAAARQAAERRSRRRRLPGVRREPARRDAAGDRGVRRGPGPRRPQHPRTC